MEHTEMQPREDAAEHIRRLRSLGHYSLGHEYISNLAPDILTTFGVATEAAQLYLVQGHYRRASELCALVSPSLFGLDGTTTASALALTDEESVCFELLRAYIDMSRHCKLDRALKVAEHVHAVWLAEEPVMPNVSYHSSSSRIEELRMQRHLLQSFKESGCPDLSVIVTPCRVLVELFYYKIQVVAAEQGMLDEALTKSTARNAIKLLQRYTISAERLREAKILTAFLVNLTEDHKQAIRILQEFLPFLSAEKDDVYRALTHLELAERAVQLPTPLLLYQEGISSLRDAGTSLHYAGHEHGHLDVRYLSIMYVVHRCDPAARFHELALLVDDYLRLGCYQSAFRCYTSSVTSAFAYGSVLNELSDKTILLTSVLEEIGAEMLMQLFFIFTISENSLQAPYYDQILKSVEKYLINPPSDFKQTRNYGYLLQLLRPVYISVGNTSRALEVANLCFDFFVSRSSHRDKSDAALQLSLAHESCAQQYVMDESGRLQCLRTALNILLMWAEKDRAAGYGDGEREKYEHIALLQDYHEELRNYIPTAFAERFRKDHQESESLFTLNEDSVIRRQLATQQYVLAAKTALQMHERLNNSTSSVFAKAKSASRVAAALHLALRERLSNAGDNADEFPTFEQFGIVVIWADRALNLYRSCNHSEAVLACTNHLSLAVLDCAITFPGVKPTFLSQLFEELDATEKICDSMRRNMSLENSDYAGGLKSKQLVVSSKEYRKFYSLAVDAALELEDPSRVWTWIQKSKARALSDLYGARALIPAWIHQRIEDDPDTRNLYNEGRVSFSNLLNALPQGRIAAARHAERCRDAMLRNPTLHSLLSITEGATYFGMGSDIIPANSTLGPIARGAIRMVDWFILRSRSELPAQLILIVKSLDGDPKFRKLQITVEEVSRWSERVMVYPEGADPPLSKRDGNAKLLQIQGLVDGLEDLTAEDDLLILSPAGILGGIPLHGLRIGEKRMIERNLVVYSSSAANLRQCLDRANQSIEKVDMAEDQASFIAAYDDLDSEMNQERHEIQMHLQQIQSYYPLKSHSYIDSTKSTFREAVHRSRWLHYHGHAFYDSSTVLRSGIFLTKPSTASDIEPASDHNDDILSVEEILQIPPFQNSPHVNLIACASGSQSMSAGDEPMGLVSALIFGGAASVLGCLWPIESATGRLFSQHFYSAIHEQHVKLRQENKPYMLNLAAALRSAICQIIQSSDKSLKQPYHWAPFVLHGAWQTSIVL